MKKIIFKLFILMFVVSSFATTSFAVPASPQAISQYQPDGTEIKIFNRGDEFYAWHEDSNGYTVVKDTDTKKWVYATKDIYGRLKKSADIVGKHSPSGIKHLKDDVFVEKAKQQAEKISSLFAKKQSQKNSIQLLNSPAQQSSQISEQSQMLKVQSGVQQETKTNFVILIQFSDLKFSDMTHFKGKSDTEIINMFNDLFNKENYNSVKNYFNEISYGKMNYQSVIYPVIFTAGNYLNYSTDNDKDADKLRQKIKEILQSIPNGYFRTNVWKDTSIKEPEGFTIIHAGGGAEAGNHNFIWSHSYGLGYKYKVTKDDITFNKYHTEAGGRGYSGNDGITPIGTVCHESLHFLGAPDLYDSTYSSKGLGNFCIMANGCWNNSGDTPAHPCAHVKQIFGIISPKQAESGKNLIGVSAQSPDAYYILRGENFSEKEYFLVENRQSWGYDRYLPGNKRGLLICHIDETIEDNSKAVHYRVDIEEADGTADWRQDHLARNENSGLDSDYYRSNTKTTFSDTCVNSPNSKSYDGKNSAFVVSEISASGSEMSFDFKRITFDNFIDGLSNEGLNFVNLIAGGEPKTKEQWKNVSSSEKVYLDKFFGYTTSENAVNDVNDEATVYYEFTGSGTVYGNAKNATVKISAKNANVIIKLNKVLELKSEEKPTFLSSVGNVSNSNDSPLSCVTETSNKERRFTGVDAVSIISNYCKNYGCLIHDFDKMSVGVQYYINDIIEVFKDTNFQLYPDHTYIKGEKTAYFGSLSQAVIYPNPARDGVVNFAKLPTDIINNKLVIEIFTVSGHLVKKLTLADTQYAGVDDRRAKWNCTDSAGQNVAPGVYIALLRTASEKRKIKFAIIR